MNPIGIFKKNILYIDTLFILILFNVHSNENNGIRTLIDFNQKK